MLIFVMKSLIGYFESTNPLRGSGRGNDSMLRPAGDGRPSCFLQSMENIADYHKNSLPLKPIEEGSEIYSHENNNMSRLF